MARPCPHYCRRARGPVRCRVAHDGNTLPGLPGRRADRGERVCRPCSGRFDANWSALRPRANPCRAVGSRHRAAAGQSGRLSSREFCARRGRGEAIGPRSPGPRSSRVSSGARVPRVAAPPAHGGDNGATCCRRGRRPRAGGGDVDSSDPVLPPSGSRVVGTPARPPPDRSLASAGSHHGYGF